MPDLSTASSAPAADDAGSRAPAPSGPSTAHAPPLGPTFTRPPLLTTGEQPAVGGGGARHPSSRRRPAATLAEAEERFRLVTEAIAGFVYDFDLVAGHVTRTAGLRDVVGVSPGDAPPEAGWWSARIHPDDATALAEPVQRALADPTCDVCHAEYRVRHADGRWVWVLDRSRFVRDGAGRVVRIVGATSDMTARRGAERALERQAEEMRALADRLAALQRITAALAGAMSPEAVAEIVIGRAREALGARAGCVAAYDATARRLRMLGVSGLPERVLAGWEAYPVDVDTPMAEAVRGEHVVRLATRAAMRARYPAREADVFAPLDARALVAVPMRAHGRTLGALLFLWSEEGRPDAEQSAFALAVADQCAQALERARLYAAERTARAEAEAASRAKSDFLATMSHELRTPLNAIQGYAQLLEMEVHGALTAAQRDAVARIDRSQQHLLGLINAVLNLARIESGRVEYACEPVAVEALCASVDPLVRPLFDRRGLAYACAGVPPGLVARCDEEKARQVLLNLLSNAAKFTAAGGSVTLVAARDADGPVTLAVRDTGIGIPADKLGAIFDPFVQVDGSRTRRAEGTGLGLAISRDLARGMGGDLTVESTPGVGSTFTLALPAG